MFKALLKKQLLEVGSFVLQDKKKNLRLSGKKLTIHIVGLVVLFSLCSVGLGMMAYVMCEPLVQLHLDWLYFLFMSCGALFFGVFGSVFNTYASLYLPKDNETLLALPIPARYIMLARMVGVYAMGLFYVALMMIPTTIIYVINTDLLHVFMPILMTLVISLFVLSLTCILGYVVAVVSKYLKSKAFITVFISLAFFAIYYYVCGNLGEIVGEMLSNAVAVGASIKESYPIFYLFGSASSGNILSFLVMLALSIVLFLIVFSVLLHNFNHLMQMENNEIKQTSQKVEYKNNSVDQALFKRELKRFTTSSTYMLNCGLGLVMLVVAAIALIVKREDVISYIPLMIMFGDLVPLLVAGVICLLISMVDISAPSISLEGKTISLLQSLPVDPLQVIKAKFNLHFCLTIVPLTFLLVVVQIILSFEIKYFIMIAIISYGYLYLTCIFNLTIGLLMPNLNWSSETIAVKQGAGVMISLFGNMGIVVIFGILFYLLMDYIEILTFFYIVIGGIVLASVILTYWMVKNGRERFMNL